jgi:hypothetical protein
MMDGGEAASVAFFSALKRDTRADLHRRAVAGKAGENSAKITFFAEFS